MSDGNYGGNGSVYWEVVHTDGAAGAVQKLKKKNVPGTHPKNDHWLDETDGSKTIGRHPVDASTIGDQGNGWFAVTMCFSIMPGTGASADSATGTATDTRRDRIRAELEAVVVRANAAIASLGTAGTTEVKLLVNVPAVKRLAPPTGVGSDCWEVNVHW